MVGHTHEDIDQYFSKLSQYLKYNSAHTLPGTYTYWKSGAYVVCCLLIADFLSAIKNCYGTMGDPTLLEHVFDIKAWLQPHLKKLHNHSHHHIFRFTRDARGVVVMHTKDWNESEWEPADSGIDLFKVVLLKCADISLSVIYYQQSFPDGPPGLVKPSLDRLDIDKLSMHASQYRVRCGISEEAQKWWLDHIQYLREFCSPENQQPLIVWPLKQLGAADRDEQDLEGSTEHGLAPSLPIDESELPPHIRRVYQKEHGPHPSVSGGYNMIKNMMLNILQVYAGSKAKGKSTNQVYI